MHFVHFDPLTPDDKKVLPFSTVATHKIFSPFEDQFVKPRDGCNSVTTSAENNSCIHYVQKHSTPLPLPFQC